MNARLKSFGARLGRVAINWASFKLGVFVGVIVGMLAMAIAMTGLQNAPEARRLLQTKLEALR